MIKKIKGNLRPVQDKVLVTDMHFGEQVTEAGIIIKDDDGKGHGIYPRWGKVYALGPKNKEDFNIGDWILIAHGRWTHGITLDTNDGEVVVRMVDNKDILMASPNKPNDAYIGTE